MSEEQPSSNLVAALRDEVARLERALVAARNRMEDDGRRIDELVARLAVPPTERREVRWLVEHRDPPGSQRYRCMDDCGVHWTSVADKAISFCRRSDAEQFAAGDPQDVRIVEHMFVSAPETKEGSHD